MTTKSRTSFPEKNNRAELKNAYDLIVAESEKIWKFTGPPLGCTCHPDDNPPRPCPKKFALSECRLAEAVEPRTAAGSLD